MKKKILALLLSALMLMVLVAGCGEEPAAESTAPAVRLMTARSLS